MRAKEDDFDPDGAAFWRFSLAFYARPGVADALIALQDRAGRDVNLILFGLWLGACAGRELGAAGFAGAEAAAGELTGLVRRLRALRRRLRHAPDRDVAALRRRLLLLDLAAERQVQARLAGWFATQPAAGPERDRRDAAEANLAVYLGAETASPEARLLRGALAALMRRD